MNNQTHFPDEIPEEIRKSFLGLLSDDVFLAMDSHETNDSQSSRRNLVRTMFAAIEGLVRIYRDHVRSIADNIAPLDTMTEMALSESSYLVSGTGKVELQTRYISLPTMLRLVTRIASSISSRSDIDFSGRDWINFQNAIHVRNRITHPKNELDLHLSNDDVKVVQTSFFWLLRAIEIAMAALNDTASRELAWMSEFFERLMAKDQAALELYEAARRELND